MMIPRGVFMVLLATLVLWSSYPSSLEAQSLDFSPVQTLQAGLAPSAIVAKDFNDDGKLDLAIANANDNFVSICLGNGDGTFSFFQNIPSDVAYNLAVGDFNGDGVPDLAVAGINSNVTLFLGLGDGHFENTSASFLRDPRASSSMYLRAIQTGDFDGDGHLDVAVTGFGSYDVVVLYGDGTGHFAAPVYLVASQTGAPTPVTVSGISALAAGDFNEDGKTDLAINNIDEAKVYLVLGTSNRDPVAPIVIGNDYNSRAISAADIYNDGHLDIIGDNYPTALLGDGAGHFRKQLLPGRFGDGWAWTDSLADFNQDGFLDIAAPAMFGSNVSFGSGDGTGAFSAAGSWYAVGYPGNIVAADFDGDGFPDFAVSSGVYNRTVTIYHNLLHPAQRPPTFEALAAQVTDEDQSLSFIVSATDPDPGQAVVLTAQNLPAGAIFDSTTGAFSWTPTYDQAGRYIVGFTATDNGIPQMSATTSIVITVSNVNRPPVLVPIGNKTVLEGQTLSFALSASDSDGDALTYVASNLPAGATFNVATGVFTWAPNYGQAGNYANVEFTVMDNGSPMRLVFEDITISVGHVNRPPIISPIGSQQVLEHDTLTFNVSATDPDGDAVTLSAQGLPAGASLDPVTGIFSWTPGYPTAGVYTPTFIATDNGTPQAAASSMDVVITVGSNPTPTEQSQALVDTTVSIVASTSQENAYLANLNKVGPLIEQGKTQPAINQINAFIQKVNQDYVHGKLTVAQRDALLAPAQALLAALSA